MNDDFQCMSFTDRLIYLQEKSENYLQTQLFMRQARPENFRTYTIVAENNVAASSKNVELFRSKFQTLCSYFGATVFVVRYTLTNYRHCNVIQMYSDIHTCKHQRPTWRILVGVNR